MALLLTYNWTYYETKSVHFSWDALEGVQRALGLQRVSPKLLLPPSPSLVSGASQKCYVRRKG